MNITIPELQKKINNLAASAFLSKGSYEDLENAIEGNAEAQEKVVIWQPFEHEDYNKVMEHIDSLADDIVQLIVNL